MYVWSMKCMPSERYHIVLCCMNYLIGKTSWFKRSVKWTPIYPWAMSHKLLWVLSVCSVPFLWWRSLRKFSTPCWHTMIRTVHWKCHIATNFIVDWFSILMMTHLNREALIDWLITFPRQSSIVRELRSVGSMKIIASLTRSSGRIDYVKQHSTNNVELWWLLWRQKRNTKKLIILTVNIPLFSGIFTRLRTYNFWPMSWTVTAMIQDILNSCDYYYLLYGAETKH